MPKDDNYNINQNEMNELLRKLTAINNEILEKERIISDFYEKKNNVNGKNLTQEERKKKEEEEKNRKEKKEQEEKEREKRKRSYKTKERIRGLEKIISGVGDMIYAVQRTVYQRDKNIFEKTEKLFKAEIKQMSSFVATMNTAFSSAISGTATNTQAAISKSVKDEAKARLQYITDSTKIEREFNIAEKQRKLDLVEGFATAAITAIGGIALALAPETAGLSLVVGAVSAAAIALGNSIKKFFNLDIEVEKYMNEKYELLMGRVTDSMDQMKSITDTFDSVTDGIIELAHKNEDEFKKTGITMGFRNEYYSKFMMGVSEEAAKIFAITSEQMSQMQKSYLDASGRNVLFNNDDYNRIEAISRVFGVSNGEISSMLGQMNIFNTSIESGYDMMDDMWHLATKIGISASKYSKDLTNNLKIAQKYNFKGGVDNMAKLTMWAEKTRFNLQNVTGFADKLMSNNISDVLELSAKLQVLGGNASIFSDPLAMMWEAGNDVGSLAKRQAAMFGDITGIFNSKTGETEFTDTDLRMIKARAEVMGMNYEDVLNQKRQSNKQGLINSKLSRFGLDEDFLTAIGNRATYNKKNGRFEVNTLEGTKDIYQLANMGKEEAYNLMLPENTDDAIMNIANDVRSMKMEQETNNLYNKTRLSNKNFGKIKEESAAAIRNETELYKILDSSGQISETIDFRMNAATQKINEIRKFLSDDENIISLKDYRTGVLRILSDNYNVNEETKNYIRLIAKSGVEGTSDFMSSLTDKIRAKKSEKISFISNLEKEHGTYSPEVSIARNVLGVKDAVGGTGGFINSSEVVPINDGAGKFASLNSRDQWVAAKPGGVIDNMFRLANNVIDNFSKGSGNTGEIHMNIEGNINLKDNYGNVNILDTLKNDPVAMRDFVRILVKAMDSTNNGKLTDKYYI